MKHAGNYQTVKKEAALFRFWKSIKSVFSWKDDKLLDFPLNKATFKSVITSAHDKAGVTQQQKKKWPDNKL